RSAEQVLVMTFRGGPNVNQVPLQISDVGSNVIVAAACAGLQRTPATISHGGQRRCRVTLRTPQREALVLVRFGEVEKTAYLPAVDRGPPQPAGTLAIPRIETAFVQTSNRDYTGTATISVKRAAEVLASADFGYSFRRGEVPQDYCVRSTFTRSNLGSPVSLPLPAGVTGGPITVELRATGDCASTSRITVELEKAAGSSEIGLYALDGKGAVCGFYVPIVLQGLRPRGSVPDVPCVNDPNHRATVVQ
ncbi:hypothetical protein L6V77_28430, partial [Myxococcota bacterium]|nr:hypothetical protein [Myxococcota bacterium]